MVALPDVADVGLDHIDVDHDDVERVEHEAGHMEALPERVPFVGDQVVDDFRVEDFQLTTGAEEFGELLTVVFEDLLFCFGFFVDEQFYVLVENGKHVDVVIDFEDTLVLLIPMNFLPFFNVIKRSKSREHILIISPQFKDGAVVWSQHESVIHVDVWPLIKMKSDSKDFACK